MRRYLLLRLDAPLMSFGGVMVDQRGVTDVYPGHSLITGLLANALGFDHGDHVALGQLQSRLEIGVRQDIPGTPLQDYQTVALGQPHLLINGWTTQGKVEERGGAFSEGTHIRYRDYLADAVYTVAIRLIPADMKPTLDDISQALINPERPLFIGRKTCLPAAPLLLDANFEAATLVQALERAPLPQRIRQKPSLRLNMWVPADVTDEDERLIPTRDTRDWLNQVHVGRRYIKHLEWNGEVQDA